eukprot:scaffold4588_cov112-Isochrysis_galbana.AAC.1
MGIASSPKRPRDPAQDNKVSQRATQFDPAMLESQFRTTKCLRTETERTRIGTDHDMGSKAAIPPFSSSSGPSSTAPVGGTAAIPGAAGPVFGPPPVPAQCLPASRRWSAGATEQ